MEPESKERPAMEDTDLLAIHQAVLREPPEPGEGRERGPWWMWVGIVLTLFAGGFYLGRFGGAFFENQVHIGYLSREMRPEAEATPPTLTGPAKAAAPASGEAVFSARCVSCHQTTGLGLPGSFPPLAGSEWVNGDPETVVRIVLDGLSGPIEVKGVAFNNVMPAWRDQMKDDEIAAVATHVRSSWGNKGGPVKPELVKKLRAETASRKKPWTADELRKLRKAP